MRNKINELSKKFYTDAPNRLEWILAGIAGFLIFFNLFYGDNITMFLSYFWNNVGLLNGTSLNWLGNNRLSYGIVQIFICEIWCLPVNIIYKIKWFEPANVWTVLWYKSFVLIFFTLGIREMIAISKKIGIEEKYRKWMVYIFATSLLVALPVFHIAQSDSIYVFFMLKGFSAYLDDDYKKFILYFALAIDCKYMAVFMFIPLVLLREKRILYIIRDAIIGVILIPVQFVWFKIVVWLDKLVYHSNEAVAKLDTVVSGASSVQDTGMASYADKVDADNMGFLSHVYRRMLYFELPAIRKEYVASVLIVMFALVCIWCYIRKRNEQNRVEDALYIGFVSMTLLFAWSSPNPYWIVAMYPITFIMIYKNKKMLRINLLLELGFSLTMFLIYLDSMPFVYGGTENFMHMPLQDWFGLIPVHTFETGPTVYGYLSKLGISSMMPIIVAICLACFIAWIIINYPGMKDKIDDDVSEEYLIKFNHGVAVFQSAFLIVWFFLTVYCLSRY